MKTSFALTRFIWLACALAVSSQSYASGIPTVDLVGNAQQALAEAARLADAAKQLKAAMDQIDQAKSQWSENKGLLTGNSYYGTQFSSSTMVDYIPTSTDAGGWEKLYSNVDKSIAKQEADKYGFTATTPAQQAALDKEMAHWLITQGGYRANNERLENIKKLQAEADRATTPQQKQDIANRIAGEQAEIQNETNRIAMLNSVETQQTKFGKQQVNNDFNTFLQGK